MGRSEWPKVNGPNVSEHSLREPDHFGPNVSGPKPSESKLSELKAETKWAEISGSKWIIETQGAELHWALTDEIEKSGVATV